MKNLITLMLLLMITKSFAQTEPYGPLPYRTLEQTIGEDYTVLELSRLMANSGYMEIKKIVDGKETKISTNIGGTIIKLTTIKGNKGYFKGNDGTEYVNDFSTFNEFYDLVPTVELNNARKLLLNKKIWIKDVSQQNKTFYVERFDPVTVTDIKFGRTSDQSLKITIKNNAGQTDDYNLSVSGTNTSLNPDYSFSKYFTFEDPTVTYHFTPAVWKMVKGSYTEIGMPMDAFRLVKGFPRDIYTTQTAKGTTQQWVYGTTHPSYYYFTNGKLTAKQE